MPEIDKVFRDASFVLLYAGVKFPPSEKDWQLPKNAHTFEEATKHKGNVGVLAGNGYIGLDQDVPEAFKGLDLPPTTFWETRPGRLGMRFKCSDLTSELLATYGKKADLAQFKLFRDSNPVGEIKLERTYQIIPPSWKIVNGQRIDYKFLAQPVEPAMISIDWLITNLLDMGITFSSKKTNSKVNAKVEPDREEVDEDNNRKYANAALNDEVVILSTASDGERNIQLNTSAFKLGQFVAAGWLDESYVIQQLSSAANYVGLSQSEIEKTIQSGLEAGAV